MHALVRHRDDDRIARRKTRFNVVILDCCRRFIYEDTDIGRGAEDLNRTFRNASGTCMAYACTANDTASDGTGGVHGMAAHSWTWKLICPRKPILCAFTRARYVFRSMIIAQQVKIHTRYFYECAIRISDNPKYGNHDDVSPYWQSRFRKNKSKAGTGSLFFLL